MISKNRSDWSNVSNYNQLKWRPRLVQNELLLVRTFNPSNCQNQSKIPACAPHPIYSNQPVGTTYDSILKYLNTSSITSSSNSLTWCQNYCTESKKNSSLFGVQGNSCYCGAPKVASDWTGLSGKLQVWSIAYNGNLKKNLENVECSTTCPGNANEPCGGPQALMVYQFDYVYKFDINDHLSWFIPVVCVTFLVVFGGLGIRHYLRNYHMKY